MDHKLKHLTDAVGIDPQALRARYRAERDRRLRPEGLGQFVRIDRDHHHRFEEDPALAGAPARAPLTDQVEIAVIGAGFGGLLLGAELRKAGIEGVRFIDRADDFGGIWYWNRYPGAAFDTQGEGVERITASGVIANGREYALDCLIHSTGYDASSPFARRIRFGITGRGGLTLQDKWSEGARTFHGYDTHDSPNLFIMAHVQTGLSLKFPHMIGKQARHIAHILNAVSAGGLSASK